MHLKKNISSKLIWTLLILGFIFAVSAFARSHWEWLAEICGFTTGSGCSHADQYDLLGLPISVWGIGFYLAALSLQRWRKPWLFYWIMLGAGVEASLILVMAAQKFVCFFCLLNAAVLLLLVALHLRRRLLWQSIALCLMSYLGISFLLARENAALIGAQPTGKEVVAVVHDRAITLTDLESEIAAPLNDMREEVYRLKRNHLEELIRQRLADGTAAEKAEEEARRILVDLQRTDSRVDHYLERPLSPFSQVPVGESPSVGPTDAKVTVIEFLDYRCAMCKATHTAVRDLQKIYPKEVRWVFKDFPSRAHAGADKLAEAARCAQAQGHFQEFQDALFSSREKIDPATLPQLARTLGLDAEAFRQCLESSKYAQAVQDTIVEAGRAGVSQTPSFIINGRFFAGPMSTESLQKLIDEALGR